MLLSKFGNDDPKPKTGLSPALEDLVDRGIMDERDIDYLNHLEVPIPTETEAEVALEGMIRAKVLEGVDNLHSMGNETKGWFLGIESKRKYVEEICTSLVDWLKDKQIDNKDLNLDMGTFKTWMKTSESFRWRYYFLLNNQTWSKIETDLKAGKISNLEVIYDVSFTDRKDTAQLLDSIDNIKDLIKIVELYKTRSNKFFELIIKRKVKIKGAPFQVILLGSTDLRHTVKKIVNLAL